MFYLHVAPDQSILTITWRFNLSGSLTRSPENPSWNYVLFKSLPWFSVVTCMLIYFRWSKTSYRKKMSLRPRRVDFDQTWSTLLETVNGVITCGSVARATWNDRFSYPFCLFCLCVEWEVQNVVISSRKIIVHAGCFVT